MSSWLIFYVCQFSQKFRGWKLDPLYNTRFLSEFHKILLTLECSDYVKNDCRDSAWCPKRLMPSNQTDGWQNHNWSIEQMVDRITTDPSNRWLTESQLIHRTEYWTHHPLNVTVRVAIFAPGISWHKDSRVSRDSTNLTLCRVPHHHHHMHYGTCYRTKY